VTFDEQGNLFVADGVANKILQLDKHGQTVASWGMEGSGAGEFQVPHMLTADRDGSLMVGEVKGMRFQKLVRHR